MRTNLGHVKHVLALQPHPDAVASVATLFSAHGDGTQRDADGLKRSASAADIWTWRNKLVGLTANLNDQRVSGMEMSSTQRIRMRLKT